MNWDEWRLARVYREPLQRAGLGLGARVLDIGGGGGAARRLMAEMGLAHLNLDIARLDSVDVVGSAEALPFSEDSFDAVVAITVLQHIRDVPAALREAARVLRPGGVAVIVEGNRWSYTLHWLRHRIGLLRGRRMRQYEVYGLWSAGHWQRHLSSVGLCDIRMEPRGWLPEALRTYTSGRLQELLVRGARAVERIAESTPGVRRAAIWVIITSRKALAP